MTRLRYRFVGRDGDDYVFGVYPAWVSAWASAAYERTITHRVPMATFWRAA